MTATERHLPVPGGRLYTRTTGATGTAGGPPVVLVHAGVAHARMWDRLAGALAADGAFTVAYDCRCFGASTTDLDGEYSDIADLASVLDAYTAEPAILVGSSRGARIAVDFALVHPERVAGLFLVPPVLSGLDVEPTDAEQELEDAIEAADDAGDTKALIVHELRLYVDGPTRDVSPGREPLRTRVAQMSRVNYAQQKEFPSFIPLTRPAAGRLAELAGPVRALVGEADTTGSLAAADALERECPAATVLRLPDTGHLLPLERPDELEHELRSWLRTLSPPSTPNTPSTTGT